MLRLNYRPKEPSINCYILPQEFSKSENINSQLTTYIWTEHKSPSTRQSYHPSSLILHIQKKPSQLSWMHSFYANQRTTNLDSPSPVHLLLRTPKSHNPRLVKLTQNFPGLQENRKALMPPLNKRVSDTQRRKFCFPPNTYCNSLTMHPR